MSTTGGRSVVVSDNKPKRDATLTKDGSRPAHWGNAAASLFVNPWPSWRFATKWERFKVVCSVLPWVRDPSPARIQQEMPTRTPTWGYTANAGNAVANGKPEEIKTTWLGHACFLVEFPVRDLAPGVTQDESTRGLRILFDPVFSNRCSPSQLVGPKRFTPPPCKIEDIPEIDVVVISHDHYDHLDTHTIRTLEARPNPPHFFAALGNGSFFSSLGIPTSRIHILDWWGSKRIEITKKPSSDSAVAPESAGTRTVDLTCTPAQHFSGRTFSAYYTTLWSSWSAEEVVPASAAAGRPPVKVFFGGDTGYRSVMDHEKEEEVPVCPVFKEIGAAFGGFDLALLPIGAYLPRQFMSPIHCAPQDSVRLFKDIKAKKAVGMHWGTWVLTTEDVLEPPKRLREECKKLAIADEDFTVCDIGESLFF